MLKTLYSVYDAKSQTYAAPFCEINDGTAIRVIQDLIEQNASHPFSRHSEDFTLERVGRFNEMSGDLETEPVGEVIKLRELTREN
tara:strand:- start:685 stop:939 length:255 start_codon:yes stop_codon:yes gene_type:complete